MVIGIIIAAIVVAAIGGTAAWQWGEAQKIEAAGKAKAQVVTADELEKWVPWTIVATVSIVCAAVIFWYWLRYKDRQKESQPAQSAPSTGGTA